MRIIPPALIIVLPTLLASPAGSTQPIPPPAADAVTVRLSSFAFDPNHLRLKTGVPIRLRLVNESSGGHNFSSPAFFAASTLLPGSAAAPNGEVSVGSHQTIEMALVPGRPGTYPLNCTHFLHSFFGMHGTVEVTP